MSNRSLIEKAIECFGDPSKREAYFNLYSDDAVVHGYQGVGPGRRNIEVFYKEFWRVFPDARVRLHEIVEQEDSVAIRYTITGTQRETFFGISSTGQAIQLPGLSFLHFQDGRCVERWACSDSMVLLNQLREAESQ